MSVPATIHELCERFERDEKRYKQDSYNEAQLRQDFLNPLFKELGWDVYHEQRATLSHREVKVEVPIKMGNEHGFLDYAFCVDGRVKFVVEAKKPWVSVETHLEAAKQVRRYGWNQKLGLSILTNFREFAIYDCTAKPGMKDTAKEFRLKYFSYQELRQEETWKWLSDRFSRSSVLGGFLDEFAAKKSGKRGSAQVDETLLQEIDGWRTELAANIYKRNEGIDVDELNYIVGKIIDRIIFLRVCEDRGIEPYETLLNLVQKGGVYPRLVEYFYKADERYNSGLFHFKDDPKRGEHPDLTTPLLKVDDVVLQAIIRGLYYPKSQFLFSEIPIEILGHVYEQFLGKVIALKGAGKRKAVEVDFKPEVRKAGGVYYTPTYIVDYIVKHTVGKLVEGKTPDEVSKLRVLDPACGSGSFLIGAYQFLLDWHLSSYVGAGPLTRPPASFIAGPETHNGERKKRGAERGLSAALEKHEAVPRRNLPIHETSSGWKLTLEEKKQILLNNIYGVDIDAQAVEVTKLSLLLKVLENASEAEIKEELAHKHHALPDLGNNIKCGNSLVGTDILKNSKLKTENSKSELSDEEIARINPFDWKTEFKSVFKQGGFDAVIGNPPYRMLQPNNTEAWLLTYLREKYQSVEFKIDLFSMFLERNVRLLSNEGKLGFIIPATILNNVYSASLRSLISTNFTIDSISVADERVFTSADVHTLVLVVSNRPPEQALVATTTLLNGRWKSSDSAFSHVAQEAFASLPGCVWNVLLNSETLPLISKLETGLSKLGELAKINRGLITGDKQKYFASKKKTKKHVPIAAGSDVERYGSVLPSSFVLFERPKGSGGTWDPDVHFSPFKLVVRQIGTRPTASLLDEALAVTGNIFTVMHKDRNNLLFMLGLLNSRLFAWYWYVKFSDFKTSFPQVTIFSLSQLPIRTINFKDKADKARHDKMVKLVERMLELNKKLPEAKTPNERTKLERQISATDREIDELVYELYGLTPDEIAIVEGTQRT